jgi:hypothetical protein
MLFGGFAKKNTTSSEGGDETNKLVSNLQKKF